MCRRRCHRRPYPNEGNMGDSVTDNSGALRPEIDEEGFREHSHDESLALLQKVRSSEGQENPGDEYPRS